MVTKGGASTLNVADRFRRTAALIAFAPAAVLTWTVLPAATAHADGPLIYPGMKINQGALSCTLGFVDPAARIGLTAGHCALDSVGAVFDDNGNRIGAADIAHFTPTPEDKSLAEQPPVDYEGIAFDDGVPINNILPNGLVLEANPKIAPTVGMPVCRTGIATGEACGVIVASTDSVFVIDGLPSDHGDSGSPVYAITEPGRAAIVGIATEVLTSKKTGEQATMAISWRAIWRQIKDDIDRIGRDEMPPQQPPNMQEPTADIPADLPATDA